MATLDAPGATIAYPSGAFRQAGWAFLFLGISVGPTLRLGNENFSIDLLPDFVGYLHAQGLGLGLWMSPLEFHMSSETYKTHPDWACTPTGHVTAQVPDDAKSRCNDPRPDVKVSGCTDVIRWIQALPASSRVFSFPN